MNLQIVMIFAILSTTVGAARADAAKELSKKIDKLEIEIGELRTRIDNLGPTAASRQVRVVDPVFLGTGSAQPSPLAMDNPIINCPRRSFVTAVQVLKTGNTVSQIRYACRNLE